MYNPATYTVMTAAALWQVITKSEGFVSIEMVEYHPEKGKRFFSVELQPDGEDWAIANRNGSTLTQCATPDGRKVQLVFGPHPRSTLETCFVAFA